MTHRRSLAIFKKKMRPTSIVRERATSIHNAFASAIALVGKFDEDVINQALATLGQGDTSVDLICVYCGEPATAADHLNGLVVSKQYSGNGQVIGNLVPCCNPCNSKKGNRPWRDWCDSLDRFTQEQKDQLADWEALAPVIVGHRELRELYRDLMDEYERLKSVCLQAMADADEVAKEIQRRERRRRDGEVPGGIADPDKPR